MMRWTVEGADLKTGRDENWTVEADDETAARAEAKRLGIAVSGLKRQLDYATPGRKASPMPVKQEAEIAAARLSIGETLLRAVAFLCVAVAGLCAVAVILVAARTSRGDEYPPAFYTAIAGTGAALFWSVLFYGASALLAGVRAVVLK